MLSKQNIVDMQIIQIKSFLFDGFCHKRLFNCRLSLYEPIGYHFFELIVQTLFLSKDLAYNLMGDYLRTVFLTQTQR